jgi:hypothetical protein
LKGLNIHFRKEIVILMNKFLSNKRMIIPYE